MEEATLLNSLPSNPLENEQLQDHGESIQIRFSTRTEKPVSSAPIVLPTSLKRYGLSQIINQLLSNNPIIPYDFLIDGVFLRTSIADYIAQKQISKEVVLDIEYVQSIVPPSHNKSFPHRDWISDVAIHEGFVLTSGYDGRAIVWNYEGEQVYCSPAEARSLKCVAWAGQAGFLAGGMDRNIRLWNVDAGQLICQVEFKGHTEQVDSLDCNPSGKVLSAGADGLVGLWDIVSAREANKEESVTSAESNKKKRRIIANMPNVKPLVMLEGHSLPVSDVMFDRKDETIGYSVGWDTTLRTWHLLSQTSVDVKKFSDPLLCMTQLPSLSLFPLGSTLDAIYLHDPRSSEIASQIRRGHSGFVSDLAPSPKNEFMFASSSFEGTVKVWDVRALSGAIHSIDRAASDMKGSKVLCVDWSQYGICSGGEDTQLQIDSYSYTSN